MESKKSLHNQYDKAAEIIKTAILQSQYEAAKDVNRIQLSLYFGIGKFLSEKTRNAKWGTNALQSISDKLKSDLPGLRGFSVTNLKKMRTFYDNWKSVDYNSSVATDEFNDEQNDNNMSLSVMIFNFQSHVILVTRPCDSTGDIVISRRGARTCV